MTKWCIRDSSSTIGHRTHCGKEINPQAHLQFFFSGDIAIQAITQEKHSQVCESCANRMIHMLTIGKTRQGTGKIEQ